MPALLSRCAKSGRKFGRRRFRQAEIRGQGSLSPALCLVPLRQSNAQKIGPGLKGLYARPFSNGKKVTDAGLTRWIEAGGKDMPGFKESRQARAGARTDFLYQDLIARAATAVVAPLMLALPSTRPASRWPRGSLSFWLPATSSPPRRFSILGFERLDGVCDQGHAPAARRASLWRRSARNIP